MVPKRISRRDLLKLGALAAGGVLAGCAPKIVEVTKVVEVEKVVKETVVVEKAPPTAAPTPFALELWSWGPMNPDNEPTKLYHDTMRERFKAKYPLGDFKFRDMGWDEVLRQNLVTALLGGTPPTSSSVRTLSNPTRRSAPSCPLTTSSPTSRPISSPAPMPRR
jgi:ABC-type glycerol-3-phosphate transport system substrate-binding protein